MEKALEEILDPVIDNIATLQHVISNGPNILP